MWKLTGQTMMSPDLHTSFAVMHLPLVCIGKAYILSFDKLVCRIIKERLSACQRQPSPKSFLSVSFMLCTNLAA